MTYEIVNIVVSHDHEITEEGLDLVKIVQSVSPAEFKRDDNQGLEDILVG